MNNDKKKTVGIMLALSVLLIMIGTTYAFITRTLTGTKKVTLRAGTLSLVLDEKNEITIIGALPMYDEVGKIQEEVFEFDLINNTSNPTAYTLKLQKVSTSNELSESDVKYYLTKNGVGEPTLLSTLTDGVIDKGIIKGNDTIDYTLRLWISDTVTDKTTIEGKSLSYKLAVEASMVEEKKPAFVDTLESKVDTTRSISFDEISSETNGRGIYKYVEDGEDIYYWRGKVEDNHVIFAGYCWEMVRTTKNSGIKMIYDGEPVEIDGVKMCPNIGNASELVIGKITFNQSDTDNAHVGYMYGLTGARTNPTSPQCIKLNSAGTNAEIGTETTEVECSQVGGKWTDTVYEATHANVVNSNIKTAIDTWFSASSLNTKENIERLEDAVYCSDRGLDTLSGYGYGLGFYTYQTAYMARYRLNDNKKPSLECTNENDRFTVNSENGNGDLTYPVGLLTADEIALAGGVHGMANSDYYLYTGRDYWAFSPYYFSGSFALNFYIHSNGQLNGDLSDSKKGVRPVITLSSGIAFANEGDGSERTPYIVE